ncbi:hypothetical protein [Streptomyces sp. NPDC047043]|uniref:hypothetical protein n=1 Tax=Streptomyces sp. NPDC047043 TaxID=3154497 RepID=UPI00340AA288
MGTRPWAHRDRLLVFGGLGVLLAVCGAVAAAAGASAGPGLMLAGTALGCWEGLGLWLHGAYRRSAREE